MKCNPSIDAFFENKFKEIEAERSVERQWAQMLDCKPGEKPWKDIKATLFVSADKRASRLIARIKTIHDQELLARIARETNRVDVCCAAIRNITDQRVLKQLASDKNHRIRAAAVEKLTDPTALERLALQDSNASVRAIALERVTDQAVLRRIAQNDSDAAVRNAAFFRIATPLEIKKHLLSSDNANDRNKLSRISGTEDLIELALYADCGDIRAAAAEKLPADSAEGNLLKAAVALSKKVTLSGMTHFEQLAKALSSSNVAFLERVARAYRCEDVRYLARNILGRPASLSVAERLAFQTPSREIAHCKELQHLVNSAVDDFRKDCEYASRNGYRSMERSYFLIKSSEDATAVADEVSNELKRLGFRGVSSKAAFQQNLEEYAVEVSAGW